MTRTNPSCPNFGMINELRGVEKKNGESFSTFSASVPRPAFEIIKVGKMWVKRKMRKNAAITLYFNML